MYKSSNYVILKVKITPKSKSKLYNYNKVLKMHQYKFYIIYIKILSMICVTNVFMCDRRDKNTNSQINVSTKYISNTHECVI